MLKYLFILFISSTLYANTYYRMGEDAPIARIKWNFIAQTLRVFDNDGNVPNGLTQDFKEIF
tara:strand:- start:1636 stop:1821 length:186 start_codon:yes stop_codon:yes gene_type:complete